MPVQRSHSAGIATLQMENLETGQGHTPIRNADASASNNQRSAHQGHMTLDGRRRPRNNRPDAAQENTQDHWDDWTRTWRRMGDKGESKPVMMTGTITRGKRRGEVVDVQLDLTRRELLEISNVEESLPNSAASTPGSVMSSRSNLPTKSSNCICGLGKGPHVLLLSILALPFVFIASILVSFYFGALTWQNIFSYYYDERTLCHRITICPVLVLTFPLFIVIFTIGIAIYAAFIQLGWSFTNWRIEVSSLEKGFYGWLCGTIGLEDCSPYTVIELFSTADLEQQQRETHQNTPQGRSGSRRSQTRRVESTI